MFRKLAFLIAFALPGMAAAGNRDAVCQATCDPADVNDQETQRLLRNLAPLITPPGTLTIISKEWEGPRRFYAIWERTDQGWRGKEQGYRIIAGTGGAGGGSGGGSGNEGGSGSSGGGWGGGLSPHVRCGSVNGMVTNCVIVLD